MTRRYRVVHATEYTYEGVVSQSYGRSHVIPRDVFGPGGSAIQHVETTELAVTPSATVTKRVDYYGNTSAYIEVVQEHTLLEVVATSMIRLDRPAPDLAGLEFTVAGARDWMSAPERNPLEVNEFLGPSPRLPDLDESKGWADDLFTDDRPVGQAVLDLVTRVRQDFAYASGSTSVRATVSELIEGGKGVCQDFAHLTVLTLRRAGLPARYVSGYLETQPPPGKVKLQGADASHAWASVLLPELGWVDLDPTNRKLADEAFVTTAWGRDYSDVPPLKGVIFSEGGKSKLKVGVDVIPQPLVEQPTLI